MSARLSARDLRFCRGRREILAGVDLDLGPGEVVSLLGANGAGKTTLLRLLLGFERPAGGSILLDGRPLATWRRRDLARHLAYVPQAHAAPFPYPVEDVVGLGQLAARGLLRAPGTADRAAVTATLSRLGIARLAKRPYTEISGGERQLVLIARALVQQARLLILDEPLAGLDFGNQIRLLDRLAHLAAEDIGILLTTHHPDLAAARSTRVAVLAGGRITDDGAPAAVVTEETIRRLYGVEVRSLPRFLPAAVTASG